MKWINGNERMPLPETLVFVKAKRGQPYDDVFKDVMLADDDGFCNQFSDYFHKSNCEWLDESPSESEALELFKQMIEDKTEKMFQVFLLQMGKKLVDESRDSIEMSMMATIKGWHYKIKSTTTIS